VSGPSDCEPARPPAGPDNGLADTGGSAHAFGGLAGGSVLAATGLTLLLRRRLTCVPLGALGGRRHL
jgi:LPXTG-motif cell wall-anchored protein